MNTKHLVESTHSGNLTCPHCEGTDVKTIMHEDTFIYGEGSSKLELPVMLPVRHCRECGGEFLDHEGEMIQHEAVCKHYGVLTPREIRDLRKKHGLTLAAFAQLTGLEEASLGRWENGILIQAIANDRYLRLLSQPGEMDALHSILRQLE